MKKKILKIKKLVRNLAELKTSPEATSLPEMGSNVELHKAPTWTKGTEHWAKFNLYLKFQIHDR